MHTIPITPELRAAARTVLEEAERADRDEEIIRSAIAEAADRGDTDRVSKIVRDWQTRPLSDVVASLTGGEPVSNTSHSTCDRNRLTVQVVAGGRILDEAVPGTPPPAGPRLSGRRVS